MVFDYFHPLFRPANFILSGQSRIFTRCPASLYIMRFATLNLFSRLAGLSIARDCDDVDNGFDNTCEVIIQETVLFSTPETDYIIHD